MSITSPVRPGSGDSSLHGDTGPLPVVPADVVAPPESADALPGGAGDAGRPGMLIAGAAFSILAVLLLGLVAQLTFVGALTHSRDQEVLYDDFRLALADSKAPVGQVNDGALVAPGSAVALIRIPAIGVDQVVVEGTTSTQLIAGPGHRRDTPLPGQAGTSVVMGRQAAFGGPFGKIAELKKGDPITVTTGQGVQTYTVVGTRAEGDPGIAALTAGQGRLTLITADGPSYAPNSTLRVDADLTSAVQPSPRRVIGAAQLPAAEKPMKGDPSAWIPLVFWAQGLLLAAVGVVWAAARWGRWQAWIVGVPTLAFLGLAVTEQIAKLLPNLM